MADTALTEEPITDGPAPVLTPEDHAMAAVDGAFGPVLARLRADAGPVHSTTLVAVIGSIRQALAHVVYGAPDVTDNGGESLDIATLQKRHATAYAAYLEQAKADGVEPDDLPTWVANQRAIDDTEAGDPPLADQDALNTQAEQDDGSLRADAGDKLFA